MSLAPAKQEVSTAPSPGAVVDPTDRTAQAADVDRKLRFYSLIQAFRRGRLPSNSQVQSMLDYLSDSLSPHSSSTSHRGTHKTTTGTTAPTTKEATRSGVEKLSPEGKKLVTDVKEILSTLSLIINEKNADELIQDFVWHTRSVDSDGVMGAVKGDLRESVAQGNDISQERVKEDGDQAAKHLRTLLTLILTNSEVRKLLSDFSLISRDLLSIGASKAAKTLSPSPEALRRVDEPAPENQFITEGGRVAGPNETPVLDADLGGLGKVRMHPKEDKQPFLHRGDERIPLGDKTREGVETYRDARSQGMGLAQEAVTGRQHPDVRDDTRGMAREGLERGREGLGQAQGRMEEGREWAEDADEGDVEEKKGGMRAKMRQMRDNVKDTFSERVPEEQRNKANENIERGKKFFSEEYFPEERRDQFIFRFKKVLIELQKHSDYQEAMRWLISFVETYLAAARDSTSTLGAQTGSAAHPHHPKNNTALHTAMLELRTILERFANGVSLDVVGDPMVRLAKAAKDDPALRSWFADVNQYAKKVLLEPGFVLQPACDSEARRLKDSGRSFWSTGNTPELGHSATMGGEGTSALGGVGHTGTYGAGAGYTGAGGAGVDRLAGTGMAGVGSGMHGSAAGQSVGEHGRYKDEFEGVLGGVGEWFRAMGNDPLNKRFGDDWARLTKDLLFDSEGSLKFKRELWEDVRRVIGPGVLKQVGYIPIPRIEYSDDQYDLVVENLTLQGRNLFPNVVEVEAHNYVKFSPYDVISDDTHHKLSFQLHQIQADMRDVAFYYHKKTGLPRMRDSGLADVLVSGKGISVGVTLIKERKDKSSVFRVADVHTKVEGLKFSIRDSKHDLLYKTLRPLMMGLVKRQIAKAIDDGIRTALEYVDGQLVGVRDRVDSAKEKGGESEEGRAEILRNLFARTKSPDSTLRSVKSKSDSVKGHTDVSSTALGASTSHSQFKVVGNKRESILADVGNPAGWVNRAAELENQGVKSEQGQRGWGSEAFDVAKTRN